MSKKEWLLTALLCLLVAGACVAYRVWPRTVPFEQCSEVYQRYYGMPGIQASFIKDKQFNDSINVDVTILQARDSAAFITLLKGMGKSDDMIKYMCKYVKDDNTRFIKLCPKGHPELPPDSVRVNNDIVATFPVRWIVVVFHTNSNGQIDKIKYANFLKTINI